MAGYTKLFSEIITSTIWREDDKTRIVWITLLALADRYGNINASIPGLVVLANVERKRCEAALRKLKSPDPDSRTRDYDGCRIEDIDGGWHILNYAKYRNKMRAVERTEYLRIKQAEHRAKKNKTVDVNTINHNQPIAEAEAEAEATTNKKSKTLFCQTSDEVRLSELLFSLILERKPDFKTPNSQLWAKHVDRMIRLDKRLPEQIEAVIHWCQKDDFWQNNILSTEKLRKQFDQLELKRTSGGETIEEQMARLRKAGKI